MNNRAKIVTITSRKGGVGKTVTTSLLARYFTEIEGYQVIVVDFDGRGGITSLLWKEAITRSDLSIVEMLMTASEGCDVRDVFTLALIKTGLEDTKYWKKNQGSLFLLPSKPELDDVVIGQDISLLRIVLNNLELTDKYLILVDTGSDSRCVQMGITAADVVFLPLNYSRQDVHPTVETLQIIFTNQKGNGRGVLGGLIVNQAGNTKWEQSYEKNYQELFYKFQNKTGLESATEKLFFKLKQSRIIKRGTYLDWTFREDLLETARSIATAIDAVKV